MQIREEEQLQRIKETSKKELVEQKKAERKITKRKVVNGKCDLGIDKR